MSSHTPRADHWIALTGNPNTGKTAIFNLLTGMNQKVSNYPGITVERKMGTMTLNHSQAINILDLPGSYSLTPESFDEHVVSDEIFSWIHHEKNPDIILSVVDAENISRNLYLTTQLLDLGIPVIVVLNMMDRISESSLPVSPQTLKERLGVADVVPVSALENRGIQELKSSIQHTLTSSPQSQIDDIPFEMTGILRSAMKPLYLFFKEKLNYSPRLSWAQSLRILSRKSAMKMYENGRQGLDETQGHDLKKLYLETKKKNELKQIDLSSLESSLRYRWIDGILKKKVKRKAYSLSRKSKSEKADRILTHKIGGPIILIGILYLIFQSVFSWAVVPMDWVNGGISQFGHWIYTILPNHFIRDLIVEGVIGGVGAVLVFLPQIIFLVLFMALLEDSGYMARIAFMLDKGMSKMGLHGRSVLPLMTGYACAIPGIMATRTIDSWKERLVTMLILPLMSCSARLPVYALMIGAFIPSVKLFGFLDAQGLTMVLMYFLGTVTALVLGLIFSRWINVKGQSTFIMELPPYRVPLMRSIFRQVFLRVKQFVTDAGKIILVISVVLWALASFPKSKDVPQNIQSSYAGKIGKTMEPLIRPLGFDWKIGISLLTSFAAREVMVSTLATIYNVESDDGEIVKLTDALRQTKNHDTGNPEYSILTGISIMVFFVFAAQCMATFAVVKRETQTWKWPLFMIFYMTGLAYLMSLIVYQGGLFLGFG
jgi:ferrous iron transport protein B